MARKSHKQPVFAEWMVFIPASVQPYRNSSWILKGSESVVRWPQHNSLNPTLGIDTYGTQRVGGFTCLKIAKDHVKHVAALGWEVVSTKSAYAYIVRK